MPAPLLTTKLYLPPPRPQAVRRPRLVERLNEGLHRKLTLLSAPAGFGKTTLVSEWVAGSQRPVAWLSLDDGDGDLTRFLTYLVAALQTIAPSLGEGVLETLQGPQPPAEALLTALLNEMAAIPDSFSLILDDYHVVESPSVDHALAFLIEHLPAQMHLVITTREDPQLPLARLRARHQLTELRAADLRFTPAEAAAFLTQAMGLTLSPDEIAALEARTEGWVAGLQLAALSMRGRADTAAFIQAFTGSHHFILDYLVEEVLQQQPDAVRSFLLQSSILDKLNGPLCDAVTGQSDGRAMLETLERGNLFVVALDDQRQWYRYHHLFSDFLQSHLMNEQPELAPALHRQASAWYAQHGLPADAIRHALAGADFERAAHLIELQWRAMDRTFQSARWLGWVKALPDDLVRVRPVLSVGYAWALLDGVELGAAERRLQDAEQWVETLAGRGARPEAPVAAMVVADQAEFAVLAVTVASARAYLAQARGDIPATVTYARRALDLLPEEDALGRAIPAAILGLVSWGTGDLEVAYQVLAEAMAGFEMSNNPVLAISGASGLADIRVTQGRLAAAAGVYEHALQLATQHAGRPLRGTADIYLGLSELHHERGDAEAAAQHLLRSEELGKQAASPQWPCRLRLVQARLRQDAGDLDGALDLLSAATQNYISKTPLPQVRPIAALKTRVWLAQGRLADALDWVRARRLSADDELSFLREFEHLTLARVLSARFQQDGEKQAQHAALSLLARLLAAAEAGERTGSVIEILIVQALAHAAQGDDAAALVVLKHALTLAEPEGYVRSFVDEGPVMARLLVNATAHGILPDYTRKLLAALEGEERSIGAASQRSAPVAQPQPLLEPLSERELDVLRLLRTELTGPEIARELVVSLNTLRTHTKHIYSKLGVNSRRTAVRRAEELDLY
ncbi:LuxR C-terminal-related transcriptional regulator [Caldilinea sp.]|uniref:LuxR C-terminal-related transcriptional regulator n=1 Tax=Caldilinea sp. TaxID=2293560 RepID=UPI002B531408|nr:LuxR C-terminal-related transcriptional regulator [Caldilinea sp.]